MIRKIIDFFFMHAKCPICKKIGHKQDMTEKRFYSWEAISSHRAFYHNRCREKTFKERLCECGKCWIKNKVISCE